MISHCIEKELGMAYVDWMIKGPKISSCSCNYGCPCEFNALPTHDVCEGLEALRIDGGFFGTCAWTASSSLAFPLARSGA